MAKQNRFTKIAVSLAVVALTMTLRAGIVVRADRRRVAVDAEDAGARRQRRQSHRQEESLFGIDRTRAPRARWRGPAPPPGPASCSELQTPRFRVDEFGREVPDVRAEAAIIYNPETGEVLWENHSKDQRSMASITKVMTALVFLESNTPLSTDGHGAAQRRRRTRRRPTCATASSSPPKIC